MESGKKLEEKEIGVLELVLKEILEEQQKTNQIVLDQVSVINELTAKVNSFDERLKAIDIAPPAAGVKALENVVRKGVSDMQLIAGKQSENLNRKIQILLFPEQDARLFYRIVFGRWLVLLTIMLLITDVFKWSIHWSDNQKQIKQEQLEIDRIKKAWNYLYFKKGKGIKKIMDSAYSKTSPNKHMGF